MPETEVDPGLAPFEPPDLSKWSAYDDLTAEQTARRILRSALPQAAQTIAAIAGGHLLAVANEDNGKKRLVSYDKLHLDAAKWVVEFNLGPIAAQKNNSANEWTKVGEEINKRAAEHGSAGTKELEITPAIAEFAFGEN